MIMEVSVEISLYPLQEEYEPAIQDFIRALRESGLRMMETPLSTLVFGSYDEVMRVVTREMKETLGHLPDGVFQLKVVSGNRSDYEPDF